MVELLYTYTVWSLLGAWLGVGLMVVFHASTVQDEPTAMRIAVAVAWPLLFGTVVFMGVIVCVTMWAIEQLNN